MPIGEKITGKVKWFDKKKGFGFIQRNDGGKDVFVHATAIEESNRELLQDDLVEFEVINGQKGEKAVRVRRSAS